MFDKNNKPLNITIYNITYYNEIIQIHYIILQEYNIQSMFLFEITDYQKLARRHTKARIKGLITATMKQFSV